MVAAPSGDRITSRQVREWGVVVGRQHASEVTQGGAFGQTLSRRVVVAVFVAAVAGCGGATTSPLGPATSSSTLPPTPTVAAASLAPAPLITPTPTPQPSPTVVITPLELAEGRSATMFIDQIDSYDQASRTIAVRLRAIAKSESLRHSAKLLVPAGTPISRYFAVCGRIATPGAPVGARAVPVEALPNIPAGATAWVDTPTSNWSFDVGPIVAGARQVAVDPPLRFSLAPAQPLTIGWTQHVGDVADVLPALPAVDLGRRFTVDIKVVVGAILMASLTADDPGNPAACR